MRWQDDGKLTLCRKPVELQLKEQVMVVLSELPQLPRMVTMKMWLMKSMKFNSLQETPDYPTCINSTMVEVGGTSPDHINMIGGLVGLLFLQRPSPLPLLSEQHWKSPHPSSTLTVSPLTWKNHLQPTTTTSGLIPRERTSSRSPSVRKGGIDRTRHHFPSRLYTRVFTLELSAKNKSIVHTWTVSLYNNVLCMFYKL